MTEKHKYESFSIERHPKRKGCWRVEETHVRHDGMGRWEGSGTYGELHEVSGVLVLMNVLNSTPVAVFKDMEQFRSFLKEKYKAKLS